MEWRDACCRRKEVTHCDREQRLGGSDGIGMLSRRFDDAL